MHRHIPEERSHEQQHLRIAGGQGRFELLQGCVQAVEVVQKTLSEGVTLNDR